MKIAEKDLSGIKNIAILVMFFVLGFASKAFTQVDTAQKEVAKEISYTTK